MTRPSHKRTTPEKDSTAIRNEALKLLIGGGGIYVIYLLYGLLQEKIFKTNYSSDSDLKNKSPKFQYGFSLVFFQSLFSYVLAMFVNRHMGKGESHEITSKEEQKLSLFNFLSMVMSNTALAYVSYPVQALMKSAKVLSILLVGLVFGGKHHTWLQYICATLITIGIFIFQLMEDSGKNVGDKATSYFGICLLLISLFSDGMLADVQKDITTKHPDNMNSFEIMASTNKYCFVLCFVYGIVTFQIPGLYTYVVAYPSILPDLVAISILGVVGQVFIFYVIKHFGPVILGIMTTTRKFFTVIASILIFKHELSSMQWACVFLVFLGVGAELYDGLHKKRIHNKLQSDLGYTEEELQEKKSNK